MRALSFLGLGNYTETEYRYGSFSFATQFFPVFMFQAFKPDILNIFITREVKEKRWEDFLNSLSEGYKEKVRPIEIPSGRDQTELWEIFQKIVSAVDVEEAIIMDVTHAFRSIPMLALMAAQYMKTTKKVIIEGIYYGAYEARSDNITPVFDLFPFIELMEWTAALSLFNATGNAAGVSRILMGKQDAYYKNELILQPPKKLKTFGKWLEGISTDLLLLKTRSAMDKIFHFFQIIDNAREEINYYAPPLAEVFDSTVESISALGYEKPNELSPELIKKEILLIEWYVRHNHFLQAIGLLRETVINLLCLKLNVADPFNYKEDRKRVESFIGALSSSPSEWMTQCMTEDEALWWKKLAGLFSKIRDRRNTLMHAEVAHEPISIDAVEINEWINTTKDLLERIQLIYG